MAGASRTRIRPLRVLFAFVWATLGAGGIAVALAEPDNVANLPVLGDAERTLALSYGVAAVLIALLVVATAPRPRRDEPRVGEPRRPRARRRPLRVVLGVLSGVAGGMALAASELSVEPVLMAGGLTGGGAASLLVSFWSFMTTKRRASARAAASAADERRDARSEPSPASAAIALEPDRVARQLREDGWFVVEGMHLEVSYVDYVAVGPAGVLAIQTFWTDSGDDGNGVRVRSRVAARKLRDVLYRHELPVEVVPVVLVCGPLPDEITEAFAVVDAVAVLVARRSELWREELRESEALGRDRCEAVRDLLATIDTAELAHA